MIETEDLIRSVFQTDASAAPDTQHVVATSRRLARNRRRRSRGTAVMLAAAACAAGIAMLAVRDQGDRDAQRTSPSAGPSVSPSPTAAGGPLADAGATKCVELYSLSGLADKPLVFDGTVSAVTPAAPAAEDDSPVDSVVTTFAVNRWFRGGDGAANFSVVMTSPQVVANGEGTPGYEIGTRLLVVAQPLNAGASDDVVALGCGFTRYYDATTASDWAAAVG